MSILRARKGTLPELEWCLSGQRKGKPGVGQRGLLAYHVKPKDVFCSLANSLLNRRFEQVHKKREQALNILESVAGSRASLRVFRASLWARARCSTTLSILASSNYITNVSSSSSSIICDIHVITYSLLITLILNAVDKASHRAYWCYRSHVGFRSRSRRCTHVTIVIARHRHAVFGMRWIQVDTHRWAK